MATTYSRRVRTWAAIGVLAWLALTITSSVLHDAARESQSSTLDVAAWTLTVIAWLIFMAFIVALTVSLDRARKRIAELEQERDRPTS